jgi:hypothetical protein
MNFPFLDKQINHQPRIVQNNWHTTSTKLKERRLNAYKISGNRKINADLLVKNH